MKKKNIDYYIDKAVDKMRDTYFWVDKSMLNNNYRYAIEKENGKDVFVGYYKYDDVEERVVRDYSDEEFIDRIVYENSSSVENYNPTKEVFEVDFGYGRDAHGWNLERYEFRSHKLGGYSAFVQAGNRSTGGSREFYIPNSYFDGTYEEFLDKYLELVPGGFFGLYRSDLEHDKQLKKFLGFK